MSLQSKISANRQRSVAGTATAISQNVLRIGVAASSQHSEAQEIFRAALKDLFAPQNPAGAETSRASWRIEPLTRIRSQDI